MAQTISIVLDFFVDIFDMAAAERTIEEHKEQLEVMEIQQRGYDAQLWALYLWNDENHSFQEVIDDVMEVMGFTHSRAKNVAETVDRVVRCLFLGRGSFFVFPLPTKYNYENSTNGI